MLVDDGLALPAQRHRVAAVALATLAALAAVERFLASLTQTTDDGGFVTQYDRAHVELIVLQCAAAATVALLAGRAATRGRSPLGAVVGAAVAALVYAGVWLVPGLMDQVLGPS